MEQPTEVTLAYRMLDGLREQRRKLCEDQAKLTGRIRAIDDECTVVEKQIKDSRGAL